MLSYARLKSKLRGFKTLKNDKNGTIFRPFFTEKDEKSSHFR